jgi:hypothetical protein
LALYRVVIRDVHCSPELGRRYLEETAVTRDRRFAAYLGRWADREGWRVGDKCAATRVFAGLLKACIFDEALLGLRQPSEAEIVTKAAEAAKHMLLLLKDGRLGRPQGRAGIPHLMAVAPHSFMKSRRLPKTSSATPSEDTERRLSGTSRGVSVGMNGWIFPTGLGREPSGDKR